jgi:hypothetical protein
MCIYKSDGRNIKKAKKQNKKEIEREKKKDRPSDFYCWMTYRYML